MTTLKDQAYPAASAGLSPERLSRLELPTPYLMMDLGLVERSFHRFHEALPGVQIRYAMKCNPDRPILERVHALGGSFEVASFTELEMLTDIGVDPAGIIFSNPVKMPDHIRRAAAAGLWRFAVDSQSELEKIALYAPGSAVYARLAVEDRDSLVSSEGKFGVDPTTTAQLLEEARRLGLVPYGLAFHVGSQKLSPDAWSQAIETCAGIMRRLKTAGIKLKMLNIGGGFAARYADHTPDLPYFGRVIRRALKQHLPYAVEIVAEPGRALVAEAGVMVARIIGNATRQGRDWLHLDVGAFNGLMESLESANQLLFPLADSLGLDAKHPYHLTGPSCDSQDTLLYDAQLSDGLKTGQLVFIYSAGAYTTSYASTFNGFSIPETHYVA